MLQTPALWDGAVPAVTIVPSSSPTNVGNETIDSGQSKSVVSTVPVLHIINGEHFSGAERVQQLLGQCLESNHFAATFACLKQGKFPQLSGLPRKAIKLAPMHYRCDLGVVREVEQILRDGEHRLIHAHTPRAAMVASLASRRTGIPWLFHVHSPTARDSTRWLTNLFNDGFERWSLTNCSKIITVSKSLRREMLSRGYSRQKVVSIPNGVPIVEPILPSERLHQKNWRLGMVALFRPRKGVEILLQSLKLLQKPNICLELVGGFESPFYESKIRTLVDQLGLTDRVRFCGFQSNVMQIIREFDAMVLPSRFGEGMPMVVLEAMACGVPVIATSVEGTPEVVREGNEGVLANPNDPVSLALAMTRLTASRSEWAGMSQRAVQRQRERYTDQHMAASVAKVYRSLL